MPDFSRPEYASYVQLCRELRLERELHRGDKWTGDYGRIYIAEERMRSVHDVVWLPTLADWLEMLKALGVGQPYSQVTIEYLPISPEDREEISVSAKGVVGLGLTEEEAIARLWMTVRKPSAEPAGPEPESPS